MLKNIKLLLLVTSLSVGSISYAGSITETAQGTAFQSSRFIGGVVASTVTENLAGLVTLPAVLVSVLSSQEGKKSTARWAFLAASLLAKHGLQIWGKYLAATSLPQKFNEWAKEKLPSALAWLKAETNNPQQGQEAFAAGMACATMLRLVQNDLALMRAVHNMLAFERSSQRVMDEPAVFAAPGWSPEISE